MRLLILNQYGLPAGGTGITRHGDLGKVLAEHGHDVTVIASRFNYLTRDAHGGAVAARPFETLGGVHFRWLDTGTYAANDTRRARSMLSYTLRATRAGMHLRERPDVVLASSPHLFTGLAGLALARWYRVPFVLELRDLWPIVLVDFGAVRAGSPMHRALEALERLLYRAADRIVVVPPLGARRVAEVGEDAAKAIHIPNGATLGGPPALPLPASLEAILRAEAGRRIVMYTGAHGVANALGNVLDAADVLRREHPATYERTAFVFVGGGQQRDELITDAARRGLDHVHFHPPIAKDAVPAALERASALLVHLAEASFHRYGLSPNKLFDYMAAGRPVLLASASDATPVTESSAGLRFEPGDPASLAAAIERLFSLPDEELEAMGRRGREAVESRYNVAATGAELERVLCELVEARGR